MSEAARKEQSRAKFDRQADSYDTSGVSIYPRKCYPYVLEELRGHAYGALLDLGCGTGVILDALQRARPEAVYCGLDLSQAMLAQAGRRLGERAALALGDAERMPYADGQFDLVVCTESFHHYPSPDAALREVRRVLRPGGAFVLCDVRIAAPLRQLINALLRFGKGGDVHMYSRREIAALLREAGFDGIAWRCLRHHAFLSTAQANESENAEMRGARL